MRMFLTPVSGSDTLLIMRNTHTLPTNDPLDGELHTRIGSVGEQLSGTMRSVLDAIPGGPHRPQELSRVLDISKDLSSRTLNASSKKDPLAVAYLMPGPASLRRLLKAASRKHVANELIRDAESAVREFERLIHIDAGDRISLDGIISSWLPDARERFETGNKQAVYRGMAQLKGYLADVGITTAMVHPSEDGETLDGVWLLGSLGLRRIRPGPPIHFFSGQAESSAKGKPKLTLDGQPAIGLDGLMLDSFCSSPIPRVDVRHEGTMMHYTLGGVASGPSSAVDLFVAELTPGCMRRHNTEETPKMCGPSSAVTTPVATLVFDVLLHEDVFPGCDPSLRVYDTALGGSVDINDPARDIDRLDVSESIEYLGWNAATFRATEIPRYAQIIDHVCSKMGWDGRKFRGYRCRAQYPVYASQLSMVFEPPTKP
jgi:hypothetical protein